MKMDESLLIEFTSHNGMLFRVSHKGNLSGLDCNGKQEG